MHKLIFTTCLILFMGTMTMAQMDRVDVTVHLKDGSTVDGMIEVSEYRPWSTQKQIAVFDKSLADEKRIKGKDKTKYKAKDLIGYESQGRYYESKKVMIAGRGDMGSTMKALPSYALIERVVDGPISVYMAYAYPPDVASGVSFDEIYEDLRLNPEYFLTKEGDKKIPSMHNCNIENCIADAPEVSAKFTNGDYGNMKRKEGKKMANFIKGQIENEKPDLIISVVKEYNAEVSK